MTFDCKDSCRPVFMCSQVSVVTENQNLFHSRRSKVIITWLLAPGPSVSTAITGVNRAVLQPELHQSACHGRSKPIYQSSNITETLCYNASDYQVRLTCLQPTESEEVEQSLNRPGLNIQPGPGRCAAWQPALHCGLTSQVNNRPIAPLSRQTKNIPRC